MIINLVGVGTKELIEHYVKIEGTAIFRVTDVYPKTVVIVKAEPNVPFYLEGWIDLSELGDDEVIKLTEATKLKLSGSWKRYEEVAYLGSQINPAYHLMPLLGYYGLGVTLAMPAAPKADRHFDYLFFAWKVL